MVLVHQILAIVMTKRLITEFFQVNREHKVKKAILETKSNVLIPDGCGGDSSNDEFKTLLGDEWFNILNFELSKDYFKNLWSRVNNERNLKKIYPPTHLTFNAFKLTPLSKIKVVIVGQDPYHQPRQAMGLCFSVPKGVPLPPSLRNIFNEIGNSSLHGDLSSWASQGVFLLNSILTVVDSQPLSHKEYGWDKFTDSVIDIINEKRENVVFLLWGRSAQEKCNNISKSRHYLLSCGHPSPLSIKYFKGCDHFKKCNDYLIKTNQTPIDWTLPKD